MRDVAFSFRLFLPDHALRVEVADTAALGAERGVAFNRKHWFAGLYRGANGEAHADAHDAPGADVEPFARLIHVDDAAREIERVGAFIDQNGIWPLLDDRAQRAQRAVEVHWR